MPSLKGPDTKWNSRVLPALSILINVGLTVANTISPESASTKESTSVARSVTYTTVTSATTQATQEAVTEAMCICSCQQLWTFLAQPPAEEMNLTIEEKVEKIVEELTISKKNTSTGLRKLISVMDRRPSSVGIGSIAGGIIFSVFGVIVLIDLSRIRHELRMVLRKLLILLRIKRIHHKDPVAKLAEATSSFHTMLATGMSPGMDKNSSKPSDVMHIENIVQTENENAKWRAALDKMFGVQKVQNSAPPGDTNIMLSNLSKQESSDTLLNKQDHVVMKQFKSTARTKKRKKLAKPLEKPQWRYFY